MVSSRLEVAETAAEPSPAPLQKHLLGGCTISMPSRNVIGGRISFCRAIPCLLVKRIKQNIFGLYVVSFKLWDLTVTKVERLQLMEWTIPINGEGFPFWETGNASFCYREESCNLSPRNFRGLLRQMSPNLYTIGPIQKIIAI